MYCNLRWCSLLYCTVRYPVFSDITNTCAHEEDYVQTLYRYSRNVQYCIFSTVAWSHLKANPKNNGLRGHQLKDVAQLKHGCPHHESASLSYDRRIIALRFIVISIDWLLDVTKINKNELQAFSDLQKKVYLKDWTGAGSWPEAVSYYSKLICFWTALLLIQSLLSRLGNLYYAR